MWAPGYSASGVKEFFKYASAECLKDRVQKNHLVLVALDGEAPVGVIEIRNPGHVSLLFVKTGYQKLGIGKRLLALSVEMCRQADPRLDHLDVNSSPFAVKIYEKLGFTATGAQQEVKGIIFTPMKLRLK